MSLIHLLQILFPIIPPLYFSSLINANYLSLNHTATLYKTSTHISTNLKSENTDSASVLPTDLCQLCISESEQVKEAQPRGRKMRQAT